MHDLLPSLIQAGPVGVFAAYLIWDRSSGKAERLALDRENLEATKAQTAAMTAVQVTLQMVLTEVQRLGETK